MKDGPIYPAERLGRGRVYLSQPIAAPGSKREPVPAPPPGAVAVRQCEACRATASSARAYVEAHPAIEARYGNVVVEHVATAMHALAVLGLSQPTEAAWDAVWVRLWRASGSLVWSNPATVVPDRVNPYPWAHVGLGQRQQLRQAYADGLRDLVARRLPPVVLAHPEGGGCLFCGIGSVTVLAEQAARLGNHESARRAAWRPVGSCPTTALGRVGPERVDGHLCPTCTRALEKAGGAVGLTARAQACVDHLAATGDPARGRRLRGWLVEHEGANYVVPAWASTGLPPNDKPWSHLREWLATL